jgi:hypothetical protein
MVVQARFLIRKTMNLNCLTLTITPGRTSAWHHSPGEGELVSANRQYARAGFTPVQGINARTDSECARSSGRGGRAFIHVCVAGTKTPLLRRTNWGQDFAKIF